VRDELAAVEGSGGGRKKLPTQEDIVATRAVPLADGELAPRVTLEEPIACG
jgi:hypothetical protein